MKVAWHRNVRHGGDTPSCVKASVKDYKRYDTVKVTNTCSAGHSLKVIWAHETDSQREYLSGGLNDSFSSDRSWPARFDGLKTC